MIRIALVAACSTPPAVVRSEPLRVPSPPYVTIQSAIDAASPGDTILVGPGTYDENLRTLGKQLVIRSEDGAATTIVDGGRRARVVTFEGGGILEGFTLRNGWSTALGGGVYVAGPDEAVIRANVVESNFVAAAIDAGDGGGLYLAPGTQGVLVESNVIRNNFGLYAGSAIYDGGANWIRDNVISGNSSAALGTVHLASGGSVVERNVITGNAGDGGAIEGAASVIRNNTIVGNRCHGIAIQSGTSIVEGNLVARNERYETPASIGIITGTGSSPVVRCNDSWGNQGGDYVVSGTTVLDSSNFSLDPIFCDEEGGDFGIREDSPCAPESSSGCALVGALPVACSKTPVLRKSWGAIRALYR